MITTKIFKSGNFYAVHLPKDCQLNAEEVEIVKRGNELVIREIPKDLSDAFHLLTDMPDDFMSDEREDKPPQQRKLKKHTKPTP